MKKKKKEKELLRQIHSGMRLVTKAPKRETPKTVYNRKQKHKGRVNTSSYDFLRKPFYSAAFFLSAEIKKNIRGNLKT